MANEIGHNFTPNKTLYSCRFQLNGDVFLSNGASDESWGTGARDADDYDVPMPEKATANQSGHYVGDFDPDDNIAEGVYRVAIYEQAGANPADTDKAIAQGMAYWTGTEMINLSFMLEDARRRNINVFDERPGSAGGTGETGAPGTGVSSGTPRSGGGAGGCC